MSFLHGVEVITIEDGPRPIKTVRSSIIGIVGTANDADVDAFPLNTPVLVKSRKEAGKLGALGSLPGSMKAIYEQCGALCIVVRVEEDESDKKTISNIIGKITPEGNQTGLQCLVGAESQRGFRPRILIAPGFSVHPGVVEALNETAERLRAVAVIDGPNAGDTAAISIAEKLGSKRLFMVDPFVKVWDRETDGYVDRPASPYVAGLIVQVDNERGFWWSPSNNLINGITGTQRPIDFVMGDRNSSANLLNENKVATIINQEGYRFWGNRTLSADPKWAFLQVVRTADIINDSILKAHLWAVDRNITKTYYDDVTEGINSYLRHLKQLGSILGGECRVDREKNPISEISQGHVTFEFDFTPPVAAEHITIQSKLVDHYFATVLE